MCTCTYGTHIYIGYVHCTTYFWKSDFFWGGAVFLVFFLVFGVVFFWGHAVRTYGWWYVQHVLWVGCFQFGVILYKNQANNIFRAVNLPLTSTAMKCQHSSPYVWLSLYNKSDWSLLASDPAKSSMTTDIKRI